MKKLEVTKTGREEDEKRQPEASPEHRISEEGAEEGLERNHVGNFGKDCGQLPEVLEGLR